MITRASIINRCNMDGNLCSRYFIQINSIEEADELGTRYDVDVLISRNLDFEGIISLVLYDEEIIEELYR